MKEDSDTLSTRTKCSRSPASQKPAWYSYLVGDVYAEDDPRDLSERRKTAIILVVAISGITGPVGSMIYMPGLPNVARDLHTTVESVNGTVSAFVIMMGIAPLFWASLSDQYGRKRMYMISSVICIIASVASALSTNIAMLVVFRALQSAGSNAGLTLGAGVIADTIDIQDRGKAYGLFYVGPLLGPVIGPTVGGFLCQYLGWRSTFYFLAILGAIVMILTAILLPETLRKVRPCKQNEFEVKKATLAKGMLSTFGPMWVLLHDPTVLYTTLYTSVVFACTYLMIPTITETFERLYKFSEWQVGLCYLAFGCGLMVGSVLSGRHSDYVVQRLERKKNNAEPIPAEIRLRAAIPAFFLIPIGYLIYGWTTEAGVGAYAPLIGLFIYALGQSWAFTPTAVYMVDSKPGSSATAVGINNCFRCVAGAVTTIFSSNLLHALGPGKLYTIIAAINILNVACVLVCMRYGGAWRAHFEAKHMRDSQVTLAPEQTQPAVLSRLSSRASAVV